MIRPLLAGAVLTAVAFVAGLPAALGASAWLLWHSIPRDVRTMRDFDRARGGLGRVCRGTLTHAEREDRA